MDLILIIIVLLLIFGGGFGYNRWGYGGGIGIGGILLIVLIVYLLVGRGRFGFILPCQRCLQDVAGSNRALSRNDAGPSFRTEPNRDRREIFGPAPAEDELARASAQ